MTRINLLSNRENRFLTWSNHASALIFSALLIICSIAVGCSSEKPQPTSSNQIPAALPQAPQAMSATPVAQAENKPAPKKHVVHKKAVTVNYADKTYGVTFEYPRRYAIETGDAATQLVMANPIPMNFVQPGGVALAAVELPETNYVNTDFSSAFFNVSVHKSLSEDECGKFAVPLPKSDKSDTNPSSEAIPENAKTEDTKSDVKADAVKQDTPATADSSTQSTEQASSKSLSDPNKLLIGDLQLRATEAVSGEGTRQSDSKYFHVFQNGACYEFALNVTTDASEEGLVKHVDRDRVFNRLEQILATVKISPVQPEVKAETTPAETPAQ